MRMLRRGHVTVREAAAIGLVSRQRVLEWCRSAGVNPKAAREAWLADILDRLNRDDESR